jgi:ribonuclease P protein component
MKRNPFRKKQRLKTNSQFRAVLANKCCASNKLATLFLAANNVGFPRLGVSVSKKCGNSPLRNRIKRMARESFRQNQHDIAPNYDYLLIFSPKMSKADKQAIFSACSELSFAKLNTLFLELSAAAQAKSVERTAK